MALAKVPTTRDEIAALRRQMAAHADNPHTGLCNQCQTVGCAAWRHAAVTLWWTGLDDSYEPYATEPERRLKIEINAMRAGRVPVNLKAPLTRSEVDVLRHELLIHDVEPDTGHCPFCQTAWCSSWIIAASCLQLNGLDQAFLAYVRATAGGDHVLPGSG